MGVVLAAGAGRRAGGPKALRVDPDQTSWLVRSAAVLAEGGCDDVIIVLGAAADQARAHLRTTDQELTVVEAPDWSDGMSASLRAGLQAALTSPADAILIHLVDLPDVTAAVVRRVLASWPVPDGLTRATYAGTPGHPVLLGRDHAEPLLAELTGDHGAQAYLERHGVRAVECGDLATGRDHDQPPG